MGIPAVGNLVGDTLARGGLVGETLAGGIPARGIPAVGNLVACTLLRRIPAVGIPAADTEVLPVVWELSVFYSQAEIQEH